MTDYIAGYHAPAEPLSFNESFTDEDIDRLTFKAPSPLWDKISEEFKDRTGKELMFLVDGKENIVNDTGDVVVDYSSIAKVDSTLLYNLALPGEMGAELLVGALVAELVRRYEAQNTPS